MKDEGAQASLKLEHTLPQPSLVVKLTFHGEGLLSTYIGISNTNDTPDKSSDLVHVFSGTYSDLGTGWQLRSSLD